MSIHFTLNSLTTTTTTTTIITNNKCKGHTHTHTHTACYHPFVLLHADHQKKNLKKCNASNKNLVTSSGCSHMMSLSPLSSLIDPK